MSDIAFILSFYALLLGAGSLLTGFLLQHFLYKVPFAKIGLLLYAVTGIYLLVRHWAIEFMLLSITAGAFCLSACFAVLVRRRTEEVEEQLKEDLLKL